jgi:CheY-like chemotaxis protein
MRPILLVEDNRDDVLFMKRAMEKAGIINPLHVASDGKEAIEYLEKIAADSTVAGPPLPALVLLDLQLPYVRGMDVLKWIREQPALRALIVIIHSSSHLDVDIAQAYRLGANSFLVKAPAAAELARMMKLIKEYWLELNASIPDEAGKSV